MNITKLTDAVQTIAEELGINLTAYGNASPTKLILSGLEAAVDIMQQTAQLALTEQNPLTATDLHSKIGLAALVGLNPSQLLLGSSGMIEVDAGDKTISIGQHAKLKSYDNVDYYAVLPSEVVKFTGKAQLLVKQGKLQQINVDALGKQYQTVSLQADNFVDSSSIEVYAGNERLSIGYKFDEQADCYVRPDYSGNAELVLAKSIAAGTTLKVIYADCIGIDGDNMQVGQLMRVEQFAYAGDEDVSAEIKVSIAEPIIHGTDFAGLDTDLTNAIMLSGHNNLIGTEAQLLQYLSTFKQYAVQSAKLVASVFQIRALRNLDMLVKTTDYWTACANLKLRTEDILALSRHLNQYASKSIELLISVEHAMQEQCRVNVVVNMADYAPETVLDIVTTYLEQRFKIGSYDVAGLYKALIANDSITECSVSYDGHVNNFGTAMPSTTDAMLICSAANITVNGIRKQYGSYDASTITNGDNAIKQVTTERIQDINSK